jgi:hypothetical protein
MFLFLYLTLILILLIKFVKLEIDSVNTFTFLVEGEKLQYTTKSKVDRVTYDIAIPFTLAEIKSIVVDYDGFIKSWANFPAFADQESESVLQYMSLSSDATRNILEINTLITEVMHFKTPPSARKAESDCIYSHEKLSMTYIQAQYLNVKNAFDKLDKTWTLATIKATVSQELMLRTVMLTLTDATGDLKEGLSEVLSTMDTLASNIFPPVARGRYHSASCIGLLFEEAVTVLDCFSSTVGYTCNLEIRTPLTIMEGTEYFPVHYADIRLRGEKADQRFIKITGHPTYQILSCDAYLFNSENIPACSVLPLMEECEKALQINDIAQSIKHCKFVKEIPHPVVQASKGTFLIQGNDIQVSQQQKNEYIPIPVTVTPLVILSPTTLKITQRDQEYIMSSITKTAALTIYKSALSQKDIQSLESQYYYQVLLDDMDSEDHMRHTILLLQLILYPLALAGLALGVKARKQFMKKVLEKNEKHKKYKSNKLIMKNFLDA